MKLRTEFLLILLAVSVTPVIIVGQFFYYQAEIEVTKQILAQLNEIADAEEARITNEIDANYDILNSISSRTTLRKLVSEHALTNNAQKLQAINQIISDVKSAIPKIVSIQIADLQGNIIASTDSNVVGQSISSMDFFVDAINNKRTLEIIGDSNKQKLLSAPLLLDDKVIGTVHVVLTTARIFSSEGKGFGHTGEYLLAERDSDGNAVLLHKSRLGLGDTIPVISRDRLNNPIIQGLLQHEGIFDSAIDYRNKVVLAATRYVEPTQWVLVVKIDRDEALQNIENVRIAIITIAVVVAGFSILVSVLLSNTISKPIILLQNASREIKGGNFDHPIVTNVGSQEIRELSVDLKHMSQELKKFVQEQKLQSDLKDQFINIAAHELKTPIQPIINYSKLAKDGLVDKDTALEIIFTEGKRLEKLSNDILDVSRIESGTMVYRKEMISINESILSVVDLLQKTIPEIDFELKLDIDTSVYADADRLTQVFENIIGNAIKFTQKGTVTIETTLEPDRNQVQISIIDRAGGIPDEIVQKLFQKFVSKKSETNVQGTGLGVFISKSIIEAHGGAITAENNKIGGATFTITLPLKAKP